MPLDELRAIAAQVAPRRGWDFSRMQTDRDPVPWEYREVVRRYLAPADYVLDVGTGGGEIFCSLADAFTRGIGIDPDPAMIAAAADATPADLAEKVTWAVGNAAQIPYLDETFDVVLNRHAVLDAGEMMRVLRPGGCIVTQQVGAQNTFNFGTLFGCGPGGRYREPVQEVPEIAAQMQAAGGAIVAYGTYNVPYYFADVESLVFWLMAVPYPQDFSVETHWEQVDYLVNEYGTLRGIATNEHRELLIVRKEGA